MKMLSMFVVGLIIVAYSCKHDLIITPPQGFVCDNQTIVTYATDVKPILEQYCALSGCHIAPNSSGINYDSYTNTKQNFEAGNTLCTIKHSNGCKPMPYPAGNSKLSDSLISIIECWVQKGYPN